MPLKYVHMFDETSLTYFLNDKFSASYHECTPQQKKRYCISLREVRSVSCKEASHSLIHQNFFIAFTPGAFIGEVAILISSQ